MAVSTLILFLNELIHKFADHLLVLKGLLVVVHADEAVRYLLVEINFFIKFS